MREKDVTFYTFYNLYNKEEALQNKYEVRNVTT